MNAIVVHPWARWEILRAVASLADLEYQERIWIRQEFPRANFYDSLGQAIHILFDDWMVLPSPEGAETILVDGAELDRLRRLGGSLERMIKDLKDKPAADYLADTRWHTVVVDARAALSAMVLAGAIQTPDDHRSDPPANRRFAHPFARWAVMLAVASLSDPVYQNRIWIRQESPEGRYGSLGLAVNTLFDDWQVLPYPRDAIGTILVDGPEIERLQSLGAVLEPVVDDLMDRPDADYVADGRWPLVVERAGAALAALVLAGPFSFPAPASIEP